AKLKQENAVLQVQLKHYKTENDALKSGQSAGLATVKQNAEVALQNLLTVITNSQSSIKQLVSGAESLQLVAELLKSIDRISEISEDGP
uniref:Endosome-associated-trafficking regulator 1 n=2 Tax=Crocodylus porosus TaxID=8502 RepID=A0A7M4EQI1_CROPO